MPISEECRLQASAIYSHLDELYKVDAKLAETKDSKSVVGMLDNAYEYFGAVFREHTHPGRAYFTKEEASQILNNLRWAITSAGMGVSINLPLQVLKDNLFNIAIEKVVSCECSKGKDG